MPSRSACLRHGSRSCSDARNPIVSLTGVSGSDRTWAAGTGHGRDPERYQTAKLRDRERLLTLQEEWEQTDAKRRGPRPPKPLGNETINRTLKVLAIVLELRKVARSRLF